MGANTREGREGEWGENLSVLWIQRDSLARIGREAMRGTAVDMNAPSKHLALAAQALSLYPATEGFSHSRHYKSFSTDDFQFTTAHADKQACLLM